MRQPNPIPNNFPAVWDLVFQDLQSNEPAEKTPEAELFYMATSLATAIKSMKMGRVTFEEALVAASEDAKKRNEFGIAKYGTPLQPFNGRDALQDAYEEALDLVAYLQQYKYEVANAGKA